MAVMVLLTDTTVTGIVSHIEYADFIEVIIIIVPSQLTETNWLLYCSVLLRELDVTKPSPDISFCYYVLHFTPSLGRDIPLRCM